MQGYEWCVSITLQDFFDEISHDRILKLIRRRIADERLVTLVARALKIRMMVDGKLEKAQVNGVLLNDRFPGAGFSPAHGQFFITLRLVKSVDDFGA